MMQLINIEGSMALKHMGSQTRLSIIDSTGTRRHISSNTALFDTSLRPAQALESGVGLRCGWSRVQSLSACAVVALLVLATFGANLLLPM